MTEEIRWGILGPGAISRQFAKGLRLARGARLAAVGSRKLERAERFGDLFSVPRRYGSYSELAADPELDIIYVATPHSEHCEHTQLCLNHGKSVLCEKPFAVNALQAESMIRTARERGLFLMEAMWSRFFPLMDRLRAILQNGVIGDPVLLQADFGFRAEFDPQSRLFDPSLGGGALLDVGIYPLSFAFMVLGEPIGVTGKAQLGQSGVDEVSAAVLQYASGALAVVSTSIRTHSFQEATIAGTKGRIRIPAPWWSPSRLQLQTGRLKRSIRAPFRGNGYQFEAIEAMACLKAGQIESDRMPLQETLALAKVMDRLRMDWGVRYPADAELPF